MKYRIKRILRYWFEMAEDGATAIMIIPFSIFVVVASTPFALIGLAMRVSKYLMQRK